MTVERRRSNDPEALRRRVLDAASSAFQSSGYHATSTHDVMREAGVTGGAFHHHFPTKKSLGLAVIRERVAPAVEETWIAPVRGARHAVDGILDVFDAIAASLDERGKVLGCPLNNLAIELSLADADFQAAVGEIFERWRKAISEKLRAEKAASTVPMDPNDFGTLVVASYSGAMAIAKANQSSEPLRACARQLATLVGRGRRRMARSSPGARSPQGGRGRQR